MADSLKRVMAVCGKGGVGKTAFSAMLTRSLVESGKAGKLLVVDADPALGLTNALGIHVEKTMGQVREEIINTARAGNKLELAEMVGMVDYMLLEALVEADNLALLAMGRSDSIGCFCPVNTVLRQAMTVLSRKFDTIVIDGEAGLEQINRQVVKELDYLVILTDTSARGLQTVSLLKEMVEDKKVVRCRKTGLVFNKVQDNRDMLSRSADKIGVDVIGFLPHDPAVTDYDFVGHSLMELPKDTPALMAVREIMDKFLGS